MDRFQHEVEAGERFRFGENWSRFLQRLDENRISAAERSLLDMLGRSSLAGEHFLDAGSGSGLFSLAARRLGARVHSFDYDPASVACTTELRRRYFPEDPTWTIQRGSVLDQPFVQNLGTFSIVYSWGVLHHTGAQWQAIANLLPAVAPSGLLFLALYNDQLWLSTYWQYVKRIYNRGPVGRYAMLSAHMPYLLGRVVSRTLKNNKPLERGMDLWYDLEDWLGGYPFEVSKPEEVLDAVRPHGFSLLRMKTCGGRHGCNEFVFQRSR